jgi:pimeloyl-ACP methyl ester carboxylesterase
MAPTIERWIQVPGSRLYSLADGDGPPVVLVHAGIADLRAWDMVVPGLVAAGYRVIRYDMRAFGRSATEDVDFSNRADLVAVLDAWGAGRAALVGNSRGGQVAFDTAVEFPDRIVAVVGVAAGLGGFEGSTTPEEQALFDEADRLYDTEPRDVDALVDLEVLIWVDGPGQPPTRVPAAIRESLREMDTPLNTPGRVDGRPIVLDPPVGARLADLRCPVLAVAGLLDVAHAADVVRHLEANAPNARAVLMPGVAHMIGMEAPDRLVELVVDFLRPLGTWS